MSLCEAIQKLIPRPRSKICCVVLEIRMPTSKNLAKNQQPKIKAFLYCSLAFLLFRHLAKSQRCPKNPKIPAAARQQSRQPLKFTPPQRTSMLTQHHQTNENPPASPPRALSRKSEPSRPPSTATSASQQTAATTQPVYKIRGQLLRDRPAPGRAADQSPEFRALALAPNFMSANAAAPRGLYERPAGRSM